MGTFVVAPFVILYLRSEGISLVTIGILYSLRGTFDVFFSLPIGHLSDKWGRKPWIISSSLSAITAYALFIVSHSPLQFVIVFVFWNFSDLFWNYSVPMYLHDMVENTGRGDALAKMSVMTTIANVVAPAPAGFLAEIYGVGILFKVALTFEVIIIGTVMYWMRSGLKEIDIHDDSLEKKFDVKRIFQQIRGSIFYFAVAMIFMSFAWALLEIATPLFLKEELGISYLGFGTIMSLTGIIGAVAKIAVGRFTDV
jgi:MFS family permease